MRDREEAEATGQRAYLEADEPWDGSGRPRVYIPEPFWSGASEELNYQFAVEETRGMLPSERLEAIRAKFSKGEPVKAMPRVRMSRWERDAKHAELNSQARELDPEEQWWQR